MTLSVNSSQGDRNGCPFAKRFAWNPFRRAYPCPFRMNLCNIRVNIGSEIESHEAKTSKTRNTV
jgi:hypothetical protein